MTPWRFLMKVKTPFYTRHLPSNQEIRLKRIAPFPVDAPFPPPESLLNN